MARLRYNGLTAALGASLTNSATSVTFAAGLTHSGGTNVPTIAGSDYIPLTILDSAGAVSEIVFLTAYTAAATTGTIARGKESTSGVAHSSGDKIVHSPTKRDVLGGRDGKPTVDSPPEPGNTKDDEFNDDPGCSGPVNGLDAKWSKHNLGTAGWLVLDDTKAPGSLLLDLPSTAQDQALYQAVPAGDFRVTCRCSRIQAGDRQMWGLFIVDTSGNGVALLTDEPGGDTGTWLRGVTGWVQTSALTSSSTTINNVWVQGQPIYLSLRKASGVYYAAAWANDRILAAGAYEVSGTPSAFTAAYVGFGRGYSAGGAAAKVNVDWLRIS